jgi:curli biogenesis system outer membrane secretion channel CsgG
MKSSLMTSGVVFLLVSLAGSLQAQQITSTARPAVAVLDFEYGAVRQQWNGARFTGRGTPPPAPVDPMNVGKGVAAMLVDQLSESGDVRLLERARVADVAREQEAGEKARARYLVMGAVTQFGSEEKTRAGSVIALRALSLATHTPFLGFLTTKDTIADVGVSCRVVDTVSGEIVGSVTSHGRSKRKGLAVSGGGVANRGLGGGGLKVGSAGFESTILGEATAAAVKDAAARIEVLLTRAGSNDRRD